VLLVLLVLRAAAASTSARAYGAGLESLQPSMTGSTTAQQHNMQSLWFAMP
jgi:hypothetical protein